MTDEQKDAWDATQWHEVKKGETLRKIAKEYRRAERNAGTARPGASE